MKYNPQGKRTLLVDPDGGTTRNEYNGWGEMTKEVQLIHMNQDSIVTINNYDDFGRLTSINRNNEITTYTYDTNNKSRINSIAIANKHTQTFDFDALDRVTKVTEDITANGTTKTFISHKEYDALGRIKKEIYPSGYYTINTYDQYSNLIETKDQYNRSIWKANTENALGQATSVFKGTKETTFGYDPVNHQITSVYANGIIDYTYGYYPTDDTHHANNLEWRADGITQQSEHFTYDTQNRLTHWDVTRNGDTFYNSMSFDDKGNITQKSDLGAFTLSYGGKNPNGTTTGRPDATHSAIGPHALSTISGVPTIPFPQTDLTVTYTDFKKIATLDEGTKHYELTYGVDDQRRMSIYKEGGVTKLTRYYVGNYEEEIVGTNVRKIHYLSGAILIQNNGVDSLLYTYSDAQGSLIALTDANGGIVRKYAYDPWGKRRDASNWNVADNGVKLIINRGYTGHEHIDAFGIINMNGRVYDPLTAMFFSPDPTLTDAGNWLDYNRYSYCLNNPFRYTDPSGYTWWAENWQPIVTTGSAIIVGGLVGILTAGAGTPVVVSGMLAGAAGGFTGGAVGTAAYGGSFSQSMTAGLQGAAMGAIMGGITAGIGSAFGPVGTIWNELGRGGVHALAQGGFSAARGGDFWQGAAAGLLSSFGGSFSGAIGITDFAGIVGVSSAMGAFGSVIAGAKSPEEILFGAVQGAMVGALNHAAHEKEKEFTIKEKIGKLATSLGISVETKNALIEWAIKGGKAVDIEKYLALSKGLGKLCGLVAVGSDLINLRENPSTANKIRLGVDVALLFVGPEASAIAGLLDISGISDKIYNYLGNGVDNSIEKLSNSYYNIQQFSNPLNWVPNY